jgi:VWFA-related protein
MIFRMASILLLAAPLLAQFGERIEVHLISIYATVVDSKGRQVTGLTKDDFELTEDGKSQKLTHFLEIQNRIPTQVFTQGQTVAAVKKEEIPPQTREALKERYILYMDNLNVHPLQRNQMMDKLQAFVTARLTGEAEAMVVSYQRSLKVLTPFLSSPDEILESLDQVMQQTGEVTSRLQSRNDLIDQIEDANDFNQALGWVKGYAAEVRNESILSMRALQDFVSAMAGIPGKKSLVYVCGGLPRSAGLEMFSHLEKKYQGQDRNAMMNEQTFDMNSVYQAVVNTANSASVSLFMVDVTGLRSLSGQGIAEGKIQSYEPDFTLETHNMTDTLAMLSEETGGTAVINTNDFTKGLQRVAASIDNYYFLGYQRGRALQDRLHKINVKVKSKKAYAVHFKRSFLEKSSASQATEALVSKLILPVEENPYGIAVEFSQPKEAEGGSFALPVTVKVPFKNILLAKQESIASPAVQGNRTPPEATVKVAHWVGELQFGFVSRDSHGERSEVAWKTHPFSIPDDAWKKLQDTDFTYKAELVILPGGSLVGVAVVNAADGTQSFKVERVFISTKGEQK